MGKTTDAKIQAIRVSLTKWKGVVAELTKDKAELDAIIVVRDKAAAAHQAYYLKKGWDGNIRGREEAMDADGAYKKLEDAFNEAWAQVVKYEGVVTRLTADAKKAREEVKQLLRDLNEFVKKKEAEKTFPWQKSSVAGAKTFIKEVLGELDLA